MIFYHDEKQKLVALKSKKQLEKEKTYHNPVVTEIIPYEEFYKADYYHQNYYDSNPAAPYCSIIIDPKIKKLLNKFGNDVKYCGEKSISKIIQFFPLQTSPF